MVSVEREIQKYTSEPNSLRSSRIKMGIDCEGTADSVPTKNSRNLYHRKFESVSQPALEDMIIQGGEVQLYPWLMLQNQVAT